MMIPSNWYVRKFDDGSRLFYNPHSFGSNTTAIVANSPTYEAFKEWLEKNYHPSDYQFVPADNLSTCYQEIPTQSNQSNRQVEGEHTGLSVSYYQVHISNPTTPGRKPYSAECNDIIEALGMTFAEGNSFKAIWRMSAARKLGKHKKGNTPLYDAEKIKFFGDRILQAAQANKSIESPESK